MDKAAAYTHGGAHCMIYVYCFCRHHLVTRQVMSCQVRSGKVKGHRGPGTENLCYVSLALCCSSL